MNIAQGIDDILEKARNTHLYNILVKLQKMASFYRMVSGFFNAAICALHGDVEGYLLHLTNGLLGAIDFFGICELELLAQVIGKTLAAYDILIRMDKLSEASENGDILGIVEHSAMIFMDLWMLTSTCFDGDTLIATNEGQKRIDEIEVGDYVWAYNVETGELELKEVLTVYVKENDEILHLKTTEGDIDTTTNHPFYVVGKGWVAAGDLEVEDEILTIDGKLGNVLSFELEKLAAPIPVYNIEVDEFHTYFVGDGDGWVLVHNRYNDAKGTSGLKTGDRTPGGKEFTTHGADQANARNFTPEHIDDIIQNWTQKFYQEGGKTVYAARFGNGYDLVILDQNGTSIVSCIGGKTQSLPNLAAIFRMLENNGGYTRTPQ